MKSVALALVLLFAPFLAQAQIKYSDSMFRRGIEELSTSPIYVLVSVRDEATGEERVVCTEGHGLLVSIAIENGLDLSKRDWWLEAQALAMSQPGRVFSFANQDAQLRASYGEAELARVRDRLSSKSDAELRQEIRGGRYRTNSYAEQIIVAHVLLARGILVGRQDYAGGLYLAESR